MTLFPQHGMKYWDDFERRAHETAAALGAGALPPLRRLSIHVTNACNMACDYCNEVHQPRSLSYEDFARVMAEYADMGGGIVHVTGGEPLAVGGFERYVRAAGAHPAIAFHLNSNLMARKLPDDVWPTVRRLKVSLDTADAAYFNAVVRRREAFERVTANLDHVHSMIEAGATDTVVSLTCTVTRENYRGIPALLEMYETRWPRFYALFFSSYKGANPRFAFQPEDTERLFAEVVPEIDRITQAHGDAETRMLFHASHEARTFQQGVRFPEVDRVPCHLQLSELVIDEDGWISNCSHLFRDKIPHTGLNVKDGRLADLFTAAKRLAIGQHPMADKCRYGCNKKLTAFNDVVEQLRGAQTAA